MTSGNGFPYVLHDLLKNEASTVVTWTSTGTAFGILDNVAFGQDVLSSYFKHNKFSSFQRQLNLYGFRKIVKGRESGCYMHPSFLRDRPDLLSEVRRGVVPPCPASYTRKVYGSGPRFMNYDEDTDSEPELIIPTRGTRDRISESGGRGRAAAATSRARGAPGDAHMRLSDLHHYHHHHHLHPGLHPHYPYTEASGGTPAVVAGDRHGHHPAYARSMAGMPQDRTLEGPPPQQQNHHDVLGELGGAGYVRGYPGGAAGVGGDSGEWRGGRPPMHAGSGGRGAGAPFYRGPEDGLGGSAPGGMIAGAGGHTYSQVQQQQQQQQQQMHLPQQYQMHQHYQLQQWELRQQLQYQGQYMHRLGTPDGSGGGMGAAGGLAGEDGLLVESPVPPFGRFLDGMDSPMAEGFPTTGASMNLDRVFEDDPQRSHHHGGSRNPGGGGGSGGGGSGESWQGPGVTQSGRL